MRDSFIEGSPSHFGAHVSCCGVRALCLLPEFLFLPPTTRRARMLRTDQLFCLSPSLLVFGVLQHENENVTEHMDTIYNISKDDSNAQQPCCSSPPHTCHALHRSPTNTKHIGVVNQGW